MKCPPSPSSKPTNPPIQPHPLTMKTVSIVQALALTPGHVDGHWELPLSHEGVQLVRRVGSGWLYFGYP